MLLMNHRVGWQAASLGTAKRIRMAKVTRIRGKMPLSLLGGNSLFEIIAEKKRRRALISLKSSDGPRCCVGVSDEKKVILVG